MVNNILEYKGFYGSAEYSLEDECFCGKLLGISDLIMYEGGDISELKKYFYEAVDEYIVHCEEYGKKVPPEKYEGSFSVIIAPEIHQKAALIASKRGMSLDDFVQKAIVDELTILKV